MPTPDDFDKKIDELKREIRICKRAIVLACISLIVIQVAYTSLSISREQTTGKKELQVVPYDPVLYMMHLASKHKAGIATAKDSLTTTP